MRIKWNGIIMLLKNVSMALSIAHQHAFSVFIPVYYHDTQKSNSFNVPTLHALAVQTALQ
jgi:hypothetical protein